jgi:hypothetical protein
MTNLPTNPTPTDAAHHLPTNPTRNELVDKYWYEFLKFQRHELFNRQKSGFGVPKVDYSEQAFWSWFLENKLEGE